MAAMHTPWRRRDVIGLPVVWAGGADRRLHVAELVLSTDHARVEALLLSPKALGVATHLLDRHDVVRWTPTSLVAGHPDQLQPVGAARWRSPRRAGRLLGVRAVTEDGVEVGTITDVVFWPESGLVAAYEVSAGLLRDLLARRRLCRPRPGAGPAVGGEGVVVTPPREP